MELYPSLGLKPWLKVMVKRRLQGKQERERKLDELRLLFIVLWNTFATCQNKIRFLAGLWFLSFPYLVFTEGKQAKFIICFENDNNMRNLKHFNFQIFGEGSVSD